MIKDLSFKGTVISILSDKGVRKDIDVGITIWDIVYTHKYIVVLLRSQELSDTALHNRNIVCLDENGKEIWRVNNPDLESLSKEKTTNAFTNITMKGNNRIEAFKADCYVVDIDIHTGKFLGDWEFTK